MSAYNTHWGLTLNQGLVDWRAVLQPTGKRHYTPRKPVAFTCGLCSKEFMSTGMASKWCGSKCKDRARYLKHGAKRRAAGKAHRELNRDEINARTRERRLADPERFRQQAQESYLRHRERRIAEALAFQKANPQITVLTRMKRNAQPSFEITQRDMRRALVRARNECTYCGVALAGIGKTMPNHLQWDHVVPLSRGGTNSIGNLAPSCRSCNLTKNRSFVTEWKKRTSARATK